MDTGTAPTPTSGAAWKVPSPCPSRIDTAVASHGIGGGQIRVAIAIEVAHRDGRRTAPTATSGAAWKVPSPRPSRIDTVLASPLAVARSGRPSPLKSPTVTEQDVLHRQRPGRPGRCHRPAPAGSTRVLATTFAVARSRWPSPLKSPTVMDAGTLPPPRLGGLEGAIALPQQDRHAVGTDIGGGQIRVAIAIEVAHRDGLREPLPPPSLGRPGRCHRPAPAGSTRCWQDIGGGQIRVAIAIEVAHRDGAQDTPPTATSGAAWKVPSPRPSRIDTRVGTSIIGRGEIRAAIAIEVAHRDG